MGEDRDRAIVEALGRAAGWVTAASLSSALGCSARTVKSAMASLRQRHPGLVVASSKGYRLADADAAQRLLNTRRAAIPQTAEERQRHILFELVTRRRELDANALADELCISPSTLDNELVPIKRELAALGLSLRSHAGQLFIEGSYASQKRLASQLIFDETRGFFGQLDLVNRYFPGLDLPKLQARIDECLRRGGYYINGYAMSNLILHIAIFTERAMSGFGAPAVAHAIGLPELGLGDEAFEATLREVLAIIEDVSGQSVAPADAQALRLLLLVSLVHPAADVRGDYRYRAANRLFFDIKRRVSEQFGLDLSDADFELRFSLHLANLLARTQGEVLLRNPQLREIKCGYPFIYEVAVSVAEVIATATGRPVNEDEIGYIALHLGCIAQRQQSCADKLHAVLVCLRHHATDAARIEAFSRGLSDLLVIDAVVDSLEAALAIPGAELVISNMPVELALGMPTLVVSPFLGPRDIACVRQRAEAILRARRHESLEASMRLFFNEDFFAIEPSVAEWREALCLMSAELIEHGFAYADFTERLLERERMSTSVYGEIAMPHPTDMDARQTAVSAALFPHGLMWNGQTVYLVLMLAIRREDRAFFQELFSHIASVLNNPGAVRSIARSGSYAQFCETLLAYA